jgi:predicted transcriptional regulator
MWQWPATFIETYLERLIEIGRIDRNFAEEVRTALASAEKNPNARMLTPLVLEIIAEKL